LTPAGYNCIIWLMRRYFYTKTVIIILAGAIILLSRLSLCAEERLTVTTYYPSPYGTYSQLTVTGNTYLATNSGSVGIGTSSPVSNLHLQSAQISSFMGAVRGFLTLSGTYTAGYYTPIDFLSDTAANPTARIAAYHDDSGSHLVFGTSNNYGTGITNTAMTIVESGNIGIGTTDPQALLHVHSAGTTSELRVTTPATGSTSSDGVTYGYSDSTGAYVNNMEATPLLLVTSNSETTGIRIQPSGPVGIGTASPSAVSGLDVAGQIRSTDTATGFYLGAGGTKDAWARLTKNGLPSITSDYHDLAVGSFWAAGVSRFDLAEVTPVRKEDRLEQGDAVVIDKKQGLRVTRSTKPYDTSVYGIISSYEQAAMVIGGIGGPETAMKSKEHLPVALIGRVKAKVSAENGAIGPGDLLTTSATPGHLMKCNDPANKCRGAVAAKALEPLEKGRGLVIVLVAVQ